MIANRINDQGTQIIYITDYLFSQPHNIYRSVFLFLIPSFEEN